MIAELNHHGYKVGASHVYPLLREMTKEDLILMEEKKEQGRIRKYCAITSKGILFLADLKLKIRELSGESGLNNDLEV